MDIKSTEPNEVATRKPRLRRVSPFAQEFIHQQWYPVLQSFENHQADRTLW